MDKSIAGIVISIVSIVMDIISIVKSIVGIIINNKGNTKSIDCEALNYSSIFKSIVIMVKNCNCVVNNIGDDIKSVEVEGF